MVWQTLQLIDITYLNLSEREDLDWRIFCFLPQPNQLSKFSNIEIFYLDFCIALSTNDQEF